MMGSGSPETSKYQHTRLVKMHAFEQRFDAIVLLCFNWTAISDSACL